MSVKLYCAWFCPFAQRAWIALLQKGVHFEYHEQDPYDKNPDWLAINPIALVPTIIHNGKSVYESPVCIEYIDEAWPEGYSLLPKDPYDRACVRIWSDHISKKIVPNYYASLMKRSRDDQREAQALFTKGLFTLADQMSESGPFFLGEHFGMVDIMLAPYYLRVDIMSYYRGYQIPDSPQAERLKLWWTAVSQEQAVAKTIQDRDRLRRKYKRYEDDSATTEVADAIRRGMALP